MHKHKKFDQKMEKKFVNLSNYFHNFLDIFYLFSLKLYKCNFRYKFF